MATIVWDRVGERLFETGVDRGVLYPAAGGGVPWNGLISVDRTSSGGETKSNYIDGYKYQNRSSVDEYVATLQAYTYPDEFESCSGLVSIGNGLSIGFQRRKSFGLSYRTKIGNDVLGLDLGYKIHIVYNCLATPSQLSYKTVGEEIDSSLMTWTVTTKPVKVSGMLHSAYFVVDSTRAPVSAMQDLEVILYGTELVEPRLPSQNELIGIFVDESSFTVTDLGGGEFEISGSDLAVFEVFLDNFQITNSGVTAVDEDLTQITAS